MFYSKATLLWSEFIRFRFFTADGEKHKFSEENPFIDDTNDSEEESDAEKSEEDKNSVASVGYRYRKWDLGTNDKNSTSSYKQIIKDKIWKLPQHVWLFQNLFQETI